MPVWEYKVISSGRGGFATPALLEKFLGDLGRDEWEIIQYSTQPENPLAFTGLARRTTQRDWTLQDAAAAAAKAEAEKLRAEFEAKFKAATTSSGPGGGGEPKEASFLAEKTAPEDGFRKPVDTSHDADPDEPEEEKDEWDKLVAAEEDELPTFFEALKPHLRRNQRGPGMSVGVDYLAKKWDQAEDDLKGALLECGFEVPEDEDTKPVYLEYDGDLYWLNINRRGELWINTKEKPRPVFRAVKAPRVTIEEEAKEKDKDKEGQKPEARDQGQKAEGEGQGQGHGGRHQQGRRERGGHGGDEAGGGGGQRPPTSAADAAGTEISAPPTEQPQTADVAGGGASAAAVAASSANPLPGGADVLGKIKPMMRRNRRGPGGSGSVSFLSRALKCSDGELIATFVSLGLHMPAHANEKPVYAEVSGDVWWLNTDSRGGVWINGREKRDGETIAPAGAASAAAAAPGAGSAAQGEGAPADAAAGGEKPAGGASGEGEATPAADAGTATQSESGKEPASAPAASGEATPAEPTAKPEAAAPAAGAGEAAPKAEATSDSAPVSTGAAPAAEEKPAEAKSAEAPATAAKAEEAPASPAPSPAPASAPAAEKPAASEAGAGSSAAVSESGTTPSAEGSATATSAAPAASATGSAPAAAGEGSGPLATVRAQLKETRSGSFAARLDRVAEGAGQSAEQLTATLVGAGLKVPEGAKEKPVYVEQGGELFWFTRNTKDEVWLNAKSAKVEDKKDDETEEDDGAAGETGNGNGERSKARRSRSKKKDSDESPAS